jgi:hypothetical protein
MTATRHPMALGDIANRAASVSICLHPCVDGRSRKPIPQNPSCAKARGGPIIFAASFERVARRHV